MPVPLRVLVVEDQEDDAKLLLLELQRSGWDVTHERVETGSAMSRALHGNVWDIVISDYSMPRFSGLEALALTRREMVDLPFILVSGTVGEEIAVEAMKAGANDYLFKGNFKRLGPAVERELREAAARSEARRIEQELKKRDRQLADAQRLACLGSWHLDVRTNVVEWSDEVAGIFGRAQSDVAATFREFLDCVHPDDQGLFTTALHSPVVMRFAQDCRITRPDGTIRYVHVRGDIMRDPGGKPLEATAMMQDITDRKLAEQELRQAHDELAAAKEVAEAASRTKDHFLAILSHELRTPLTPILALVSLWQSQMDLPEDFRRQLNIIHRNVNMEVRLIDDLLDLTSIVRDKIELHFEVTDAHAALRESIQMFEKEISAKRLKLEVRLDAVQHHIWADSGRLRQIFMNLVSNAVKFTPAGESISIASRNDDQGRLQIQISDHGIGIEADVLPRLFNSFEQGERTITRRFGGLGLGLSIAKSLVEMHKGKIAATSEGRNKGTTLNTEFDTIPAEVELEAVAPAPCQEASRTRLHGRRVLLVEDHEDTRQIVSRLLAILGCSVKTAGTVGNALDLVAKEPFDLLVSDVGLPDGSGTDIMKFIKGRYNIKGIAVSGFGQEEDIQRSRDAGFYAHLTKPVDFTKLQGMLEEIPV